MILAIVGPLESAAELECLAGARIEMVVTEVL